MGKEQNKDSTENEGNTKGNEQRTQAIGSRVCTKRLRLAALTLLLAGASG